MLKKNRGKNWLCYKWRINLVLISHALVLINVGHWSLLKNKDSLSFLKTKWRWDTLHGWKYFQKKLQVECIQIISTTAVILGNKHPQNLSGIQQVFIAFTVLGVWLGRFVGLGWPCTLGSAALGWFRLAWLGQQVKINSYHMFLIHL